MAERSHGQPFSPVLMIGLDAAEWSLIERWMDDGSLPELRALREEGMFSRLRSTAEWLVGSPWPSFYTGMTPADHGLYHYLLWRPELMTFTRPGPDWLPLRPFWRDVAPARDVIVVDVPLTYAPERFPGIEISGWTTHETLQAPASWPPEMLTRIRESFSGGQLGNEEARLMTAQELLQIRDKCLRSVDQATEVAVSLIRDHRWDLFLMCLAAPHRAGHQLWDSTNTVGPMTLEEERDLKNALKAVYVGCDAALGRMIRAAGSGTTVLVFALHGMGPNVSRCDILGEMLARVLDGGSAAGRDQASGNIFWQRMRKVVPAKWRSAAKGRLPYRIQDWLTQYSRMGDVDWARTRAFAQLCDLDGYIRINLRGREAAGVVEPGGEYEELCASIADGLRSFVDADTGRPVVSSITRPPDLYEAGDALSGLPDLMVRWDETPAASHQIITSPKYGTVAWPMPGKHPQGRSGNHRPDGFLLASGDAVKMGLSVRDPHILDLAPSVYGLLGLDVPKRIHGRCLFRNGARPA